MNVPTALNVSSLWQDGCSDDPAMGSIGTSYSHSCEAVNSTATFDGISYHQHQSLRPANSIVIIFEEGKIIAFLLCLIALMIGSWIMARSLAPFHTYSVKLPLDSLLSLVTTLMCTIGNGAMLHLLLGNSPIIASVLFLISMMPIYLNYNVLRQKISNLMLDDGVNVRPISSIKEKESNNLKHTHGVHGQGSFLLCNEKKEEHDKDERSQILKSIIETKKQQNIQSNEDRAAYEIGKQIIARRNESLGPNVSAFYADEGGLVVTRGEGCYLLDPNNNKYLDCCNNVAAVGHSHPRVVEAGISSLSSIQTNSRFLHPAHQRYIDKLLQTFPSELNTVYLVNSGSEANDLALRIARAHADIKGVASKPHDVICLDSAYHGHTQSLVEISPYKWYQATDGKRYQGEHTHVASLPDSFRGKHRGFTEETGLAYARDVQDIVRDNHGIGTFIAESVVGCGGQVELPPTYLKRCYDVVREYGGVTIADEVQTGFGRSGEAFWYFQTYGVIPDIVTFGKPVAVSTIQKTLVIIFISINPKSYSLYFSLCSVSRMDTL